MTTNATNMYAGVTLEAVIIRADGTREDLGVISRWHRNPWIRAWYAIRRRITGRV